MQTLITIISENWALISILLVIVASILNSVTDHFGKDNPKIVPILAVIIEALSIITSKGTSNGRAGKLKLPLQNVPENWEDEIK